MAHFIDVIGAIIQMVAPCVTDLPLTPRKPRDAERAAAFDQFRAFKASDGCGQVVLDGREAEILDVSDSFTVQGRTVHGYVLTLLVVTPSDRYFLFKSNAGGRPFVKELSMRRAQCVLKTRFRRHSESHSFKDEACGPDAACR